MEKQPCSIFNDVIGPVMRGPSSSHVAGANIILSGFDKVVPLDETIQAIYDIGLSLPLELRCTDGGLGRSSLWVF